MLPETFQTQRALASLKSEIKQRQKIFNAYGVNHIDAYSKLYRQGKAREALPHLIIISDEFAELKKEQPEFIKELVSAARVGRSLGVHLILATQKPSGVVDDEIWSNSRFKLCLKVQDRQDSMEMLKRPEAAELVLDKGISKLATMKSLNYFSRDIQVLHMNQSCPVMLNERMPLSLLPWMVPEQERLKSALPI